MFVPILAYHKVQKQFDPGFTNVPPEKFEKQIRYLSESGFTSTSVTGLISGNGKEGKKIIISFDDAYSSVYDFAYPILKKYNFSATLFVITKFVGRQNSWDYHLGRFQRAHCTWNQIRELSAAGWEVGSHTVTHPNLNRLSNSNIWFEVMYSKIILEARLNAAVNVISYPFGRFNQNVIRCVRRAGYSAACALGITPAEQCIPYALHRRGVYLLEPISLFRFKLEQSGMAGFEDWKQKFIAFCAQGSLLVRYLKNLKKIA